MLALKCKFVWSGRVCYLITAHFSMFPFFIQKKSTTWYVVLKHNLVEVGGTTAWKHCQSKVAYEKKIDENPKPSKWLSLSIIKPKIDLHALESRNSRIRLHLMKSQDGLGLKIDTKSSKFE